MIPLILFVLLGIAILVIFEVRARKERNNNTELLNDAEQATDVATEQRSEEDGCCGEHLVCERETLLQTNAKVEYYDDEELDTLAGIDPADYSETQHTMLREVFDTLQERDVAGWVRSLQLRNIALPQDIREEALMIVRERRKL